MKPYQNTVSLESLFKPRHWTCVPIAHNHNPTPQRWDCDPPANPPSTWLLGEKHAFQVDLPSFPQQKSRKKHQPPAGSSRLPMPLRVTHPESDDSRASSAHEETRESVQGFLRGAGTRKTREGRQSRMWKDDVRFMKPHWNIWPVGIAVLRYTSQTGSFTDIEYIGWHHTEPFQLRFLPQELQTKAVAHVSIAAVVSWPAMSKVMRSSRSCLPVKWRHAGSKLQM